MENETLTKFNNFRKLCLTNSDDAVKTAELLLGKNVNHIAFHLSVIALEEIGKIFIGWYQLNAKESWGKEHFNIPIDDHIKKLFWAIWGPSFANEKFTKEQMDEIKTMATHLHSKRLDVMYTDLSDTLPSSSKITDDETERNVKMVRARLELAKLEGEVDTELKPDQEEDMKWFMEATNISARRTFIFGHQSQEKLIEFGNVKDWIAWLKDHFQKEEKELKEIIEKEIEKSNQKQTENFEPKWKIRFKIISPSHSIRANVLNSFSNKNKSIKLSKGSDNHTLIIDLILDKNTTIQGLWHHGWMFSRVFVAALNVGTNGIFYWNTIVDTDKYYDKIWDLENNKQLVARLSTDLQLNWSEKKMFLHEEELALTFLVFRYFSSYLGSDDFEPINDYILGLGMLAKTDIHLRLETQIFLQFFIAFKRALMKNENCDTEFDIKEIGYKQIEQLITDRTEFDKTMDIGNELHQNKGQLNKPITLTEVIGMKQYCGLYFITLAARKLYNDKTILLTKQPTNE